jgi:hypothetical protein
VATDCHPLVLEEAARDYIALMRSGRDIPRDEFLERALGLLATLVDQAIRLSPSADAPEITASPHEQDEERIVENGLDDLLGSGGIYWAVSPKLASADTLDWPGLQAGSLAEDLAVIFGSLVNGLRALDEGNPAAAEAAWHTEFWSHWGAHAVEAAGVILEMRRVSG